jgi:hypothetical protein
MKILPMSLGAVLLVLLSACRPPAESPTSDLQRLEYYLRWSASRFEQEHPQRQSWLMPPAHAELPPEHQRAFSLRLTFDHGKKQVVALWQSRMVTDAETFQRQERTYGDKTYDGMMAALNANPLTCEQRVEPGWAGPSPEMLRLTTPQGETVFYAGGPNGPDGPDEALSKRGLRRYLCGRNLMGEIEKLRADLSSSAPLENIP